MLKPEQIAEVAHEVNRAYCEAIGDMSHLPWEDTPEDIQRSAVDGVEKILSADILSPEDSHSNWMQFKIREGWTYGETKDYNAKTHPCLVPYDQLPVEQRVKDHIFRAVVLTIASLDS